MTAPARTLKLTVSINGQGHVFTYKEDVNVERETDTVIAFCKGKIFLILMKHGGKDYRRADFDEILDVEYTIEAPEVPSFPKTTLRPFYKKFSEVLREGKERFTNDEVVRDAGIIVGIEAMVVLHNAIVVLKDL